MKKFTAILAFAVLIATPIFAGGALETVDITGDVPSPIAGHVIAKVIGIKWDARMIPVPYRMNNSLDPVPNPLGAPFLSVAQAQSVMQASFDEWNRIPTSFINMQIVGTTPKTSLQGFDQINEITFRTASGFTAIASSPSVSLIRDVTLVHGQDIDGDGDADVSSAITAIADVDGDGDNEFPARFYRAGTILDNDVQFNTKTSNGLRFTVADSDADTASRSVDLMCVAVHEFGHSFGLSHVLNNQDSNVDGNGATMYPFIDTGDPVSELSQRSPNSDDIAWASYFYPEGSASSGPAALQAGDIAFDKRYGLITGEIRHGVLDQPIAGASVFTQAHQGVLGHVVGAHQAPVCSSRSQRIQRHDAAVALRNGRPLFCQPAVQHHRWQVHDSGGKGELEHRSRTSRRQPRSGHERQLHDPDRKRFWPDEFQRRVLEPQCRRCSRTETGTNEERECQGR